MRRLIYKTLEMLDQPDYALDHNPVSIWRWRQILGEFEIAEVRGREWMERIQPNQTKSRVLAKDPDNAPKES